MTTTISIETEFRIAQLIEEFGRRLDNCEFKDWTGLFDGEDAKYMIHPRENLDAGLEGYWMYCESKAMIRDRILALENANIYNIHYDRHLVSGIRVVGESGGVYEVRASYCVIQTDVEGRSEIFSAGEYRAKVVKVGMAFRLKEMVVVPDTFNIQRPLAVPM